jgi:hypothetical protein
VEWQTPEWEWVDPQSEQAAAKDAIDSFMSDYQTELGSRGRAWRAVFYQRKKEQDLKKKLGLLTPQEQQLAISAAQSGELSANADQGQPEQQSIDVAATALNGAQVTSLVDVITQVGTGAMPKETSKAIIAAAFPTMSVELVNKIIDPIDPGSISADGVPQPSIANPLLQENKGSGEMMGLSTLQFNRNRKAILKTLEDLASGAITEAAARVFLSSIGINDQNVQLLIEDAQDGSVDTPIEENADAV